MKKTNVQKAKDTIAEIGHLTEVFTGLKAGELSDLFFHTAWEWVENFVGKEDKEAGYYLTQQVMFWGFWVTEWTRVQEDFINRFQIDEHGDWFFPKGQEKVTKRVAVAQEYVKFMRYWMLQNKANSAVLELAFHKRIKQEVAK